jgi:hypothetical protein
MTEHVVFFAAIAVGALKAANRQQGHANCNQKGKQVFSDGKPMNQAIHLRYPARKHCGKSFRMDRSGSPPL